MKAILTSKKTWLLNQSLGAALESARKRLTPLEAEIKYLDAEQDDPRRLAKEKKIAFDLREGEQQIGDLRGQAKELNAFAGAKGQKGDILDILECPECPECPLFSVRSR